jgi:hypothetical protein
MCTYYVLGIIFSGEVTEGNKSNTVSVLEPTGSNVCAWGRGLESSLQEHEFLEAAGKE